LIPSGRLCYETGQTGKPCYKIPLDVQGEEYYKTEYMKEYLVNIYDKHWIEKEWISFGSWHLPINLFQSINLR